MNWYFNAFSTVAATAAMLIITYFFVPSKLSPNHVSELEIETEVVEETGTAHGREGRGLLAAGIFTVIYLGLILASLLPVGRAGAALRSQPSAVATIPKSFNGSAIGDD
ncbi:hypothetical protein BC361_32720 [Ensifer sp. LC54]|nr:hypothetical protein BC361_32720 [Ensifer sp. LC54]OCP17915.1 hypothetical protein BC363_32895 [Ensifer sp. LC384]